MIGKMISHYAPKAHPSPTAGWRAPLADRILEKSRPEQGLGRGCSFRSANGTALGEVPKSPMPACVPKDTSAGRSGFQRMVVILIPLCGTPFFGGRGERCI